MKQHHTNKHSNLHREDQHITVEELWRCWKSSEGVSISMCVTENRFLGYFWQVFTEFWIFLFKISQSTAGLRTWCSAGSANLLSCHNMRRILKNLKLMETHFPGETVSGIAVMWVEKPRHVIVTSVCRIAANEPSFLSFHLHIQDQRDKQKLNIKALDAVLFGPPTRKDRSLTRVLCFFYIFFLLDTWGRQKIF